LFVSKLFGKGKMKNKIKNSYIDWTIKFIVGTIIFYIVFAFVFIAFLLPLWLAMGLPDWGILRVLGCYLLFSHGLGLVVALTDN
jgi:hypothetical protein